jgi:hypothetical protein
MYVARVLRRDHVGGARRAKQSGARSDSTARDLDLICPIKEQTDKEFCSKTLIILSIIDYTGGVALSLQGVPSRYVTGTTHAPLVLVRSVAAAGYICFFELHNQ